MAKDDKSSYQKDLGAQGPPPVNPEMRVFETLISQLTDAFKNINKPAEKNMFDATKLERRYTGSRKESVEEWIDHVELRTKGLSEEERVRKAFEYVTGPAEIEFADILRKQVEANNFSWSRTASALRKAFKNAEYRTTSTMVEQEEDEHVQAYLRRCKSAWRLLNLSIADREERFFGGLNATYLAHLASVEAAWIISGKTIIDLDTWAEALSQFDFRIRGAERKANRYRKASRPYTGYSSKTFGKPEEKPQKSHDYTSGRQTTVGNNNPSDKRFCYYCKKEGKSATHKHTECPLFKTAQKDNLAKYHPRDSREHVKAALESADEVDPNGSESENSIRYSLPDDE
jgi:hypothetical protein